ncbi:MAG: hypothetical protein BRD23_03725 [Halobacteriales archaeon SW_9_67_25]|nr:MAG: hypothetical protein BRD23_03725 [Halobacteriales archaeon SW_9_67_25]
MSDSELYEEYREAGQQLHSKILDAYSDRELILDSAEALGLEHDGTNIFYESESDMTVHYEFLLYEYQWDGKTAAERFNEAKRWDTATERRVLAATLEAETSLFAVTAVDESDYRFTITDVLGSGEEVSVLDINLSQHIQPGIVLFVRPVQYENFATTSGVFFPFSPDELEYLLDEYENRADHLDETPTSTWRYAAFYDLYRECGIQTVYR